MRTARLFDGGAIFRSAAFFNVGLALICIGLFGAFYTSGVASALEVGGRVQDISAYLYLLFYIGYPGIAACAIHLKASSGQPRFGRLGEALKRFEPRVVLVDRAEDVSANEFLTAFLC